MKNARLNRTDGFTLIELLVVVLIIGILASVALPQYQKAVEKSRSAQALTLLKSVGQAQEAYKLANGDFATSFDELPVEIAWTGNTPWLTSGEASATRSNADWSIQLVSWSGHAAVYIGRLAGKYRGIGFIYWLQNDGSPSSERQISCAERVASGVTYSGADGSYCGKVIPVGARNYQDSAVSSWSMRY